MHGLVSLKLEMGATPAANELESFIDLDSAAVADLRCGPALVP